MVRVWLWTFWVFKQVWRKKYFPIQLVIFRNESSSNSHTFLFGCLLTWTVAYRIQRENLGRVKKMVSITISLKRTIWKQPLEMVNFWKRPNSVATCMEPGKWNSQFYYFQLSKSKPKFINPVTIHSVLLEKKIP